jgi:arylamine N-acetyltransferase
MLTMATSTSSRTGSRSTASNDARENLTTSSPLAGGSRPPLSHFTQSLICSLPTEAGRVSISGRTLIQTIAGERTEQDLPSDAAVLSAYLDNFGISLDRPPDVGVFGG